jgi:hypothetical protein
MVPQALFCFVSNNGLFSISMILENRDGLYYCLTNVFTVDWDPVQCNVPIIHRAVLPPTLVKCHNKAYSLVSKN